MVWGGATGYDRFVANLKDTPLQLQLTKDEWRLQKVTKASKLPITCSKCGITALSVVHNVVRLKKVGCACSGRFKYNTPNGRTILQRLVDKSRFTLKFPLADLDLSRGGYSRIELRCQKCLTDVTPQVGALLPSSCGIGCFCARPDEAQVRDSLVELLELWADGTILDPQFKFFGELKGKHGKPFTADFALIGRDGKLIVVVEVDGWYHFNGDPKSRPEDCNRTKEHDIVKENWCIDNEVPLVRISTSFVKLGLDAWNSPFWSAVNEAASGESNPICRLSHDNCYTKGSYADVRVGTALEVVDSRVVID